MKYIYLLILMMCFSLQRSFAQGSTDQMFTIHIKGFSLENRPKILNDQNPQKFSSQYVNGLVFNFNENQINYRIGGSYYNHDYNFQNTSEKNENLKGKLNGYAISFGFSKNLTYTQFQPYIGMDLGFRNQNYKGNSQDLDINYQVNTSKNGGYISPLVGLRFNIIPNLGIYIESSMMVLFDYERVDKHFDNSSSTFSKKNNTEFLLNPVQAGLQFSFGGEQ